MYVYIQWIWTDSVNNKICIVRLVLHLYSIVYNHYCIVAVSSAMSFFDIFSFATCLIKHSYALLFCFFTLAIVVTISLEIFHYYKFWPFLN